MKKISVIIFVVGIFSSFFAGWARKENCQVDYINQWGTNVSVGLKINGIYSMSVYFSLTPLENKAYLAEFMSAQNSELLIDVVFEDLTQPAGTDHKGKVPYALGGVISHK